MHNIHVKIADMGVARGEGVIGTVGLGSCVAITIYDPGRKVGGMAHILLPDSTAFRNQDSLNPAKFADTAVPTLIGAVMDAGGNLRSLEAKMAGGSQVFMWGGNNTMNVGQRNIEAVRQAIEVARVPLVGEDVGGSHGRTVRLDVATGQMVVVSAKRQTREV